MKKSITLVLSLFSILMTSSFELIALPELNQVVDGTATLSGDTVNLQINQASDKAVLNWNSFNVAANESVNFQQPKQTSICLNRIDAANGMSQINGNLTATGTIYLINQAGVLFGKTAQVNVSGIVASASDISNESFLNGPDQDGKIHHVFDQASTLGGAIINKGVINVADRGLVAFLGSSISNDGVINTSLSEVHLASGNKFTLDFYGNHFIELAVGAPATQRGLDENGNALPNGVNVSENAKIIAKGGEVYLTSDAVQGVFDNLINMDGIIWAKHISSEGGRIVLSAKGSEKVQVTGNLVVSGADSKQTNLILISGENISIDKYAEVQASVVHPKGGAIIIGAGEKFAEATNGKIVPTKTVYIGPNTRLSSNCTFEGDAGGIFVTGTETTFLGIASANGGSIGGNGGNIMVIGKGADAGLGLYTTRASEYGKPGTKTFISDPIKINLVDSLLAAKLGNMLKK